MKTSQLLFVVLVSVLLASAPRAFAARDAKFVSGLELPSSESPPRAGEARGDVGAAEEGTKWALLIAGSNGYWNYRHQADVCHAYQLLKKDGLKDENIVVFMYDDIANNAENPHPGIIINHPKGKDVYAGVPKDYTGENVTVDNFLAALAGDASAIKGGSGKVIASGPHDTVFVFYSDHGGPGILGMPGYPFLMADDINAVLMMKRAKRGFKELVFYLEACESGSIFQGLLPKDINVYAVTAANADESSWGTYCPGMDPSPPPEFYTCLGDLFSVAWMEDSDTHNLNKETLKQQYLLVKDRTSAGGTFTEGSHVMRYGNSSISTDEVAEFIGSDPANDDAPGGGVQGSGAVGWFRDLVRGAVERVQTAVVGSQAGGGQARGRVDQREADLLYFKHKYLQAQAPSAKALALLQYQRMLAARAKMDLQMETFGDRLGSALPAWLSLARVQAERGEDAPLVDDWHCLRGVIRAYEGACGPLTQYGMKHTRVFAALCNALGDATAAAAMAAEQARHTCVGQEYNGPFSV